MKDYFYDYDENLPPWESGSGIDNVTALVIQEGVTNVGGCVIWRINSITTVTIPNSVTKIDNNAFLEAGGLTTVNFGTGLETIGDEAFGSCSNLKSIVIPDGVTFSGGRQFRSCSILESVTLGNQITSVPFEQLQFCRVLTSITFRATVTSIGSDAFYECNALESLDLSHVTNFGNGAFYKCTKLSSVDLSSTVYIGDYSTSSNGNVFRDCTSLQSINIPKSVLKIKNNSFMGCTQLKTITIGNVSNNCFYSSGTPFPDHKFFSGDTELEQSAQVLKGFEYTGTSINHLVRNAATVTFNSNGGEGSMGPQDVPNNVATKLIPNTFTKSGYRFDSWNTDSEGKGTSYADEASVQLTEDLTLYAQWTISSCQIQFETYGGTGQQGFVQMNGDILNNITVTTTKEGCVFCGFYTDSSFSDTAKLFDAQGNAIASVTGYTDSDCKWIFIGSAKTLYAKWLSIIPVPTAVTGLKYTAQVQTGVAAGTGYTLEDNTATAAGNYTATAKISGNYCWDSSGDVSDKSIPWTIGKTSLSVTADAMTTTYGDEPPAYSVTYDGFVGGETETVLGGTLQFTCTYVQWSDVGDFDIIPSGLTSDNYDITFSEGILTVGKADYDMSGIVFEDVTPTYDGETHAPAISGVLPAGHDGIQVTVSYSAGAAHVSDGTVIVTATFATDSGNYNAPDKMDATVTILPLKLTGIGWTAPADLTYDGTAKVPSQTAEGVVEGDAVTVAASVTPGMDNINVGTFTFTATGLGSDDYVLPDSVVSPGFTILQRQVTVKADDLSKTLGEVDPVLTATVTGTVGSDTITYSISRDAGEEHGIYAITVSGEVSQGNYSVTFVPGIFFIKALEFKVTFDMNGHGTAPSDQTIEYMKWAIRPADPLAEGYTFAGWYKDTALTVLWNFPVDQITADTVIHAKWTENTQTFSVSFDAMGHGKAPKSETVAYGGLAARPDNPSAKGFVFAGWYKEKSLVDPWIFDSDRVTSDVALYAKWTKENVPVEKVSISMGSTIIGSDADDVTARFTVDPVDATPFSIIWTSSDEKVLKVEMASEGFARLVPMGIGTSVVTVSVDGKTASVTVTVAFSPFAINESKEVATIDEEELLVKEIELSAVSNPSVALDLSERNQIEMSKNLIDAVKAKNGTIAISTVSGTAVLNSDALGKLTEDRVTIQIDKIDVPPTVPEGSVAADVSALINGVKKPIEFGEPVLVGIAHELAYNEDVNDLTVYYVQDDGTVETIEGAYYADGMVYFYAPHFSVYAAVFGIIPDNSGSGISLEWYLLQIVAAAITTIWAVLPAKRREEQA